jgi:uncharacterized protein YqeY
MTVNQSQSLFKQIQEDMRRAVKQGDRLAAEELRSLLARISNAEAVDNSSVTDGSTEVARRSLDLQDMQKIITDEMKEIQDVLDVIDSSSLYGKELQKKIEIISIYQ